MFLGEVLASLHMGRGGKVWWPEIWYFNCVVSKHDLFVVIYSTYKMYL